MSTTTGVKFIFDADGNSQKYVDGLIGRLDKLKSIASGDLKGKLAGLLTIGAVEEAVRRTGEWADNLRIAANAVGENVEQMQALNLAGSRVNVNQEKQVALFEKLEAAILGAMDGNTKYLQSFKALGISLDDNKTKAQVFNEILEKVGSSPRGHFDASIENIFGTRNTQSISNLGEQVGPGGLSQYQKDNSAQIVSTNDVNTIADSYHQIIADFKEIGTTLAPVGSILLSLVSSLVGMLKGVVNGVSDLIKGTANLFKHPWETLKHGAGNLGEIGVGLTKTVTDPTDFVLKRLGGKGGLSNAVDSYYDPARQMLGVSAADKKNYQAVGSAIALVLGSEAGTAARSGAVKAVAADSKALLGDSALKDLSVADRAAYNKILAEKYNLKTMAGLKVGQGALIGADAASVNNPGNYNTGSEPLTIKQLRESANNLNIAVGSNMVGGSSSANSNLHIGGTVGTDIGTRLIVLNETMVSLLSQLVTIGQNYSSHSETGNTQHNNVLP